MANVAIKLWKSGTDKHVGINVGSTDADKGYALYTNGSIHAYGNIVIAGTASRYKYLYFHNHAGTQVGYIRYDSGNATNVTGGRFTFLQYSGKSTADTGTSGFYEAYWLPNTSAGLTASVDYNILTTKSTITVAQGGTGATTAANALTNLGALPLAGGTMTGQIKKAGVSKNWVKGRDGAVLFMSSINGYSACISIKTTNGSWQIGAYDNSGYTDQLIFSYTTDTNYTNNSNTANNYTLTTGGLFSGTTALTSITETNPSSATTYYIPFMGGVSGSQTLRGNSNFRFWSNGTKHALNLGSSSGTGVITFWTASSYNIDLIGATATATRTITLPNATGTVSLEGHKHAAGDITSGTLPIARGGTGADTAAGARANLGTWALVSDSYNTLMPANGTTNGWIKIGTANTSYGLLPSQSGSAGSGHNYLGTSSWYWKYAYIDQIYGTLNGDATKLGTATVGGVKTPIYLNAGTATACNTPTNLLSSTMSGTSTTAIQLSGTPYSSYNFLIILGFVGNGTEKKASMVVPTALISTSNTLFTMSSGSYGVSFYLKRSSNNVYITYYAADYPNSYKITHIYGLI